MNKMYKALGITKQSFHQMMDKINKLRSEQEQLFLLVSQIREDHPTMGIRDMYYKLRPLSIGRDTFELFCKGNQLTSRKSKNWRRTTDSSGVIRFDNLLKKETLTSINQVWQSDITYYEVEGRFYYLTFILDAFSRRILGHSVSMRLATEQTTVPALAGAIKLRQKEGKDIKGLIFHSDGGGQYYAKEFLKLTQRHGIRNSMCEYAWENGKAERLNGVIKNNYLIHRDIRSFEELSKEVDRTVLLYNKEKPHIELQRKTPFDFEKNYLCYSHTSEANCLYKKTTLEPIVISE